MKHSYVEIDRIFRNIFALKKSIGTSMSRSDRATVLIGACIEQGFDTKDEITKWLRVAGLSPKHVVELLEQQTGSVPGLHLWRCDEEGQYHLLNPHMTPSKT